jgi:predicted DNA-binding transcriptional regulator AlpA
MKSKTLKSPAAEPAPAATPAAEPSPSIRAAHVGKLLGTSRATAYIYMARAGFPRPRKISPRFVVFDRAELLAWRDQHLAGDAR